jgi:hypothetical protein
MSKATRFTATLLRPLWSLHASRIFGRESLNGGTKLPVIYALNNAGGLTAATRECPAKGVVGEGQGACVDYRQSNRQGGDLYLFVLFTVGLRASVPLNPLNKVRQRRYPDDASPQPYPAT